MADINHPTAGWGEAHASDQGLRQLVPITPVDQTFDAERNSAPAAANRRDSITKGGDEHNTAQAVFSATAYPNVQAGGDKADTPMVPTASGAVAIAKSVCDNTEQNSSGSSKSLNRSGNGNDLLFNLSADSGMDPTGVDKNNKPQVIDEGTGKGVKLSDKGDKQTTNQVPMRTGASSDLVSQDHGVPTKNNARHMGVEFPRLKNFDEIYRWALAQHKAEFMKDDNKPSASVAVPMNITKALPITAPGQSCGGPSSQEGSDMPIKEVPTKNMLIKDMPIKDEPVKDMPTRDEPVKDEPVKDEPVKDEPIKDMPIKDEPIRDMPIKDEPLTLIAVPMNTAEAPTIAAHGQSDGRPSSQDNFDMFDCGNPSLCDFLTDFHKAAAKQVIEPQLLGYNAGDATPSAGLSDELRGASMRESESIGSQMREVQKMPDVGLLIAQGRIDLLREEAKNSERKDEILEICFKTLEVMIGEKAQYQLENKRMRAVEDENRKTISKLKDETFRVHSLVVDIQTGQRSQDVIQRRLADAIQLLYNRDVDLRDTTQVEDDSELIAVLQRSVMRKYKQLMDMGSASGSAAGSGSSWASSSGSGSGSSRDKGKGKAMMK
ncbi:hypothetical protein SUNI508_05545 [Seiridium unicorne]|uniref:Uncharacterized protein n=1 Tax=Seiridium unicorne TaxID=138068 RepID=A0ABR2V3X3_9PEZI